MGRGCLLRVQREHGARCRGRQAGGKGGRRRRRHPDSCRCCADGGSQTRTVSLPSQQIGPLAGTPDAIAADQAGVYWLTHANELWMLDGSGGSVPRRLAAEVAESLICSGYGRLAVAGDQLFWAAEWWAPGDR